MPKEVETFRIHLPGRDGEHSLIDFGGDGPVALLAHATGFCAALWAPVARSLCSRMRVFAVDARGHGDSFVSEGEGSYRWSHITADLAELGEHVAERAGQSTVALGVGHSFGGTTILGSAALRPALYERLLLVDPVVVPRGLDVEVARGNALSAQAGRRRAHWPSVATARERLASKPLFSSWDPEVLDLYFSEAMRREPGGGVRLKCDPAVESATFAGAPYFDWASAAPKVAAECLILFATGGNFSRQSHEELASTVQNGRVEDFDAGHLIPMEQPAALAERALRFAFGDE